MNRYTYLIQFIIINYNLIELIYIHDYMGPCIQDILSSRAALGLPVQPLGRVRRASEGILHTTWDQVMLVQLAAQFFVLLALKLFSIIDVLIF